jgi:hypothetical protein
MCGASPPYHVGVRLYGAVLRCRNKVIYANMSYEVDCFWQEAVLRNSI